MSSIACSVYIVTLNCEPWLENTLNSVKEFAQVIILDSGSTDRTQAIANRFDNVVFFHQDWLGYAKQKALALSYCQNPWVLNLDGDETLSPELRQEIVKVIEDNRIDALSIPINDVFLGKPVHYLTKKHAKVRFFRKDRGHYDLAHLVHEHVMVDGVVERASGYIYHYGDSTIGIKVQKNNDYSALKAEEKFKKHKKPNLTKLVFVMPLTFIKSYIIKRNCMNGWRGFVNSMINAFYAFLKEAKLFEKSM